MFEKPIGKNNIPNKSKEKPTIAESHPHEPNIPAANSQAIDPIVTQGKEQGHGESGSTPTTNTGSDTQTQGNNNNTDLERVNQEITKHKPDSPAYKALLERQNKLSGKQTQSSEQNQTNQNQDVRNNLKGNYGQKNNSESTNPSELSGSPSAGSDPFINLRKKYGSEPLSAETSNKNKSQETGEEKRF